MAVARAQIKELLELLASAMSDQQLRELLKKLTATEAYRRNSSFRETVDRLIEMEMAT